MDCFYAAVEMRDDPTLVDKPIAVGGRPDQRGVLTTANYVARKYGLKSAMPTAQALKLCPQLVLIPPRHQYYKQVSLAIHEILARYTDLIEPISLDEAYLDVTDSPMFKGSATLIASDIRKHIADELGLTASAGVAPLMFLAKIASDINKPNGMYVITPEDAISFIEHLELKKIPGIGKVTSEKLKNNGLKYCNDIKNSDLSTLIKLYGKLGKTMWDYAHGIEHRLVTNNRERKSISVERTFNSDVFEWIQLQYYFDQLYDELVLRVLRNNLESKIAKITVKIKFTDFKQTTQETTQSKMEKHYFLHLIEQIWSIRREARGVRTIGLGVVLRSDAFELNNQLNLDLT